MLLVGVFLEKDIGITTFLLCLGNFDQEVAGIDFFLLDFGIGDEFVIHFIHIQFIEVLAVFLHHGVRVVPVTGFVLGRQLHKFIGNDHADRERLDADFFIHVDFLAVQKFFYVGMENVEIHSSGSGTLAELVGIGEGVFQNLHDGQYPAGAAFHAFDGFAARPDFGNIERYAAPDGRKLHGRIHGVANAVVVVPDFIQKAGNQFAGAFFPGIEE